MPPSKEGKPRVRVSYEALIPGILLALIGLAAWAMEYSDDTVGGGAMIGWISFMLGFALIVASLRPPGSSR